MTATRKLVVVLGAHRSGTSVCAAAVAALGAFLGEGVAYANKENPKGFFEHPSLVEFNDRLLEHLGGAWDNPLFRGADAVSGAGLESWQEEAVGLLGEILGDADFGAVKDPRLCQLLPFWLPVFSAAGFEKKNLCFVHTFRGVTEVARSSQQRAQKNQDYYDLGLDLGEGAALWLSLTSQSLLDSRGANGYFVSYQRLLEDPASIVSGLADFLGVQPDPARVASFCDEFVDESLRHATRDPEAVSAIERVLPQALELEALVEPAFEAGEKPDYRGVRRIADRRDTRETMTGVMSSVISRLAARARTDRLNALRMADELEDAGRQRHALEGTINGLHREHASVVTSMHQEHEDVLAPLRTELEQMQQATQSQTEQLHRQAAVTSALREQLQTTRIAFDKQTSDFRAAVLHHRETLTDLESEVAALRQQAGEEVPDTQLLRLLLEQTVISPLRGPLYALKGRLVGARTRIKRLWMRFRLKAIEKYHGMSMIHPATAWTLRRVLRPLVHVIDWLLGDSPLRGLGVNTSSTSDALRFQQLFADGDFRPFVSVIVPNFNHAPYLDQRLQSIYTQSYEHFEVILLDDASTDDSTAVLEKYRALYPEKTSLEINTSNSGSVFAQWQKGLAQARGDIVWIAESDDWCSENFLAELVPYFENEAVQLAYSRTLFMDSEGDKQVWSLEEYLHDVDPLRWTQAFVETGPEIARNGFAVKNIIPNVSSAVFRKPTHLELLADEDWRAMRTCGDWILYLHLLRGGMLAYTPRATNYYRMHDSNTSVNSYREDEYYREHEAVAKTVNVHYDVDQADFERLNEILGLHWRNTRNDFTPAAFESCFSLQRIHAAKQQRAPNLLMASYAFCAGGGETFPVSLANIMKSKGYNVTYLDCAQEPRMEGIRQRLRPDISIVSDFRQLERIVQAFDIDVIHSHHAWMEGTVMNLLPEDSRVKLAVTLHGMYETMNEFELKSILPRLARRVACFIYVAEKNLNALRDHGIEGRVPMVRIDNALPQDDFEAIDRADLGLSEEAFVLTLVSRGMAEKGWAEGIAAVTKARDLSGSDIQLLLVGDGPEYERLSARQLPGFVHLLGFQRNVKGFFSVADAGFLPSRFRGESFPLVIIECLQAGKPFLANDLGEIRRMLGSEEGPAGAVVKLKRDSVDVDALADQIAQLSTDKAYYAGLLASVPAVSRKFDPALLADRHDEVYRSISQVSGPAAPQELAS